MSLLDKRTIPGGFKATLDEELARHNLPAISLSTFKWRYPDSTEALHFIFALTKVFILEEQQYKWGGVLRALDVDDSVLLHTCASQASTTVIHYALAHGVYYRGIGDFPAHISLWAVERYLKDMTMFKRRVRNWARVGFGFVDGAVKRNRLLAKKLHEDGWFLRNPWIVCGVIQLYFLRERASIGWQLELFARQFNQVFIPPPPGVSPVVLWTVRMPPSIMPLTMAVVGFNF